MDPQWTHPLPACLFGGIVALGQRAGEQHEVADRRALRLTPLAVYGSMQSLSLMGLGP